MRTYWVYGDWTELKLQRDLLLGALDDSPSLMASADMQVAAAYEHAHGIAVLHGLHYWPETTPWQQFSVWIKAPSFRQGCRNPGQGR